MGNGPDLERFQSTFYQSGHCPRNQEIKESQGKSGKVRERSGKSQEI